MNDPKLDPLVGKSVTLRGTARNAQLGAVLLTPDRTPVYIAGLEEWAPALDGQTLDVTGTLTRRKLAPDPTVDADGGISHGVAGTNYVVDDARWGNV